MPRHSPVVCYHVTFGGCPPSTIALDVRPSLFHHCHIRVHAISTQGEQDTMITTTSQVISFICCVLLPLPLLAKAEMLRARETGQANVTPTMYVAPPVYYTVIDGIGYRPN
ncbi:hypothetical protein IE81DRAFT_345172 [Ceraceosorus guamensis]|uniref:Uncharacterized protein n=1 Tax=Ceraceosorus guamensis TaxID=1522189 RepID=A0A316W5I5_9BASI|nr:hypothetical protein IE81DRAFT_345172 [Ceraceosorus guamensis]PWN45127.1 hypothetical protein IE81DRAFT_345172 [Ceraceosorus guamensis]